MTSEEKVAEQKVHITGKDGELNKPKSRLYLQQQDLFHDYIKKLETAPLPELEEQLDEIIEIVHHIDYG